jgi:hypothetical protein
MLCHHCLRHIGTTSPAWVVYDGTDGERTFCSLECLCEADPLAARDFDHLVRAGDAFFQPAARRRLDRTTIL